MKNIKNVVEMIKQENYILTPRQKRYTIMLFFIVFIGSCFELLGVTAILPFIESLLDLETVKVKWYLKIFIDFFGLQTQNEIIVVVGLLVASVYLVKNAYLLWSLKIQYSFRYDFQKELSTKMLNAYLRRPYQYFLNINSAQILRGIEGDVIGVFGIYEFSFKFVAEILNVLLIGLFLLYTDWVMAVGVLALAGICFIVVTCIFKKLLRGAGEKQREAEMLTKKYAYQAANGIKDIHVMKKNEYFIKKYDMAYENKKEVEKKQSILRDCPEKIIEASCIIGLLGIVCIRIIMGVDAQEFVPQLSVFAVAAFRILPSISRMIGYITGLIYQRPALAAAYKNLIEVEEYEESIAEYIRNNTLKDVKEKQTFNEVIEIKNICWSYPNAEKDVLYNLNLKINKGDTIGLIGSSGAGKSTLADIMLGLFKPQQGNVYVDKTDIYTIPNLWAKMIGYVPQVVYLTDDTIRNNIAFGVEVDEIDDSAVWRALEQAQLKEFVRGLPDSLDTIVGERGIKFSGGQRQRIAIARALYYNPDILVLDEATSALDNETELAVMESIERLQGEKTLIIVAHRLTTLRKCNKIYEIKDGKAFECDVNEVISI